VKISLVIRCYNEEQHIGRLLDGILQQDTKDVEIIVVDSGSTDSTVSIVSGYPIKLLTIPKEEFSFGRSLNLGCSAVTGDIIVIASAHVYPTYKDWLERMVSPFSDPKVALVYGGQRGDKSSAYSEHQILAKWFPDQTNLDQDHPFCNNANSAIRRVLWEEIKYDETLTGLEDTDWAKRAMGLGYKVAYVAEAEVAHIHKESLGRIYNRYLREAIAFSRIFPQERFGFSDFVRLFAVNALSDYRHAVRDGVLKENLFGIFGFRMMHFLGTYRGFKQSGPITSQLKRTFYYPNDLKESSNPGSDAGSRRKIEYVDNQTGGPVDRQR